MKKGLRKIPAIFLTVILAFSCVGLGGCSWLFDVKVRDVSFAENDEPIDSLSLFLGDSAEIGHYVRITPTNASNKSYTVQSDDASVVEIRTQDTGASTTRTFAEAVGVGSATLTVTTESGKKTATLTVNVSYAPANSVAVVPDASLTVVGNAVVMQRDEIRTVSLTASLGENTDPAQEVAWTVAFGSDETVSKQAANQAFSFTPSGVGQTLVTVAVGEGDAVYTDTLRVNVYDRVENACVTATGKLSQQADSVEPVVCTIRHDALPPDNPEPIVSWQVWTGTDDARTLVSEYVGYTFAFVPSAPGKYEIVGSINGKTVDTVVLRVSGIIVPQNVWLDYDDCYPEVWIRWDDIPVAAGYEVSIVNRSTGREIASSLNTNNTAARAKFTSSGVNATSYFTDGNTVFDAQFEVKVKTLADDEGILEESGYSSPYVSARVPNAAKPYLTKTFYDGARNYYVKSFDEFYEWFEYVMLWRPAAVSSSSGDTIYMNYNFASAIDELSRAMDVMHFTGNYAYAVVKQTGKACSMRITFETANVPTRTTDYKTHDSWDAMRPHVNYDTSKARLANYRFAIDSKTPVTVETSEQLYYIAQLGYRPIPKSGSVADRLYTYARNTLRYIVTDDMTDVEKLHAIYDWIMWRVVYDDEVAYVSDIEDAVQYTAYYLESVFTDTDPYGVCDAMSKAYVLMACIEGFECVRVTGDAVSGGTRGGHAWNKVKLYGQWYVVDCTWGDFSVQIQSGGVYRESASHMYFLLSDNDIRDTHIEDDYGNFPRTAAVRYPWYAEYTEDYDGTQVDFYLSANTRNLQSELNVLAQYMTQTAQSASQQYYVYPCPLNSFSSYYGYELVADTSVADNAITYLKAAMSLCGYAEYGAKGASGKKLYSTATSAIGDTTHILLYLFM